MFTVVTSSSYPTRKANLKRQEPRGGLSGRKLSAKRYLALFQELGIFSASVLCTFVQSGVHWRGEVLLLSLSLSHTCAGLRAAVRSDPREGRTGALLCSVTEQRIQPGLARKNSALIKGDSPAHRSNCLLSQPSLRSYS